MYGIPEEKDPACFWILLSGIPMCDGMFEGKGHFDCEEMNRKESEDL